MPNQHRVALIGYGAWGRNIARNLARLDPLGLICDWKPDALDEARRRHPDVERQTSIDAVVADARITACELGFRAEVTLRKGLEELIAWRRMAMER